MYEHSAGFLGGPPNKHHFFLYDRWGSGDWGMVLTGNVQVSRSHLSLGRDIVLPSPPPSSSSSIPPQELEPYTLLASAIHGSDTQSGHSRPLAIMQLNHTGRQSPSFIGGRSPLTPPLAPSPVRLGSHTREGLVARTVYRLLFQTPREMTMEDIDALVSSFIHGARVALESGFDGVQLHASHGCKSSYASFYASFFLTILPTT